MIRNIVREIKSHLPIYLFLFVSLIGASYFRLSHTINVLGFYYDQGRDALVIWNFIHNHQLFLVGPTTGIAGIFRGPWYYWLILPFYFLGKGNPVWPANFLAITSLGAIFMLYLVGKEVFDREVGLIAAIIASFSYYLIVASRWLSNPTPMLLISTLLVWALIRVSEKRFWAWPLIGFLLGMAVQFGSAAEVFYVPAAIIFAVWQRKNFPSIKVIALSIFLFLVSFIPQAIFDIRHGGILSGNIFKFLFSEGSFKLSFWKVLSVRIPFYWEVFSQKIWIGDMQQFYAFFLGSLALIVGNFRTLWKKTGFKVLALLALSPLIGMIFFQGNEGNVFDYYFTGYYLIFVLLFSIGLGFLAKSKFGLIFLILFFFLFFKYQLPVDQSYMLNGRSTINLKEQLEAIDWIYKDTGATPFNVDVYVPPVIPYAYQYLFYWKGQQMGINPSDKNIKTLYTIYEEDTPIRLVPWLNRQDKIGRVVEQVSFRGLTVQKRVRYEIR